MKPEELGRRMRSEANRLDGRAAEYDEVAAQLRAKAEALRRRAARLDTTARPDDDGPGAKSPGQCRGGPLSTDGGAR